jgi:hypothetical protein
LARLGDLGEELMSRALAGLDGAAIAQMTGRMNQIKNNLKKELNCKG